MRPRWVIGLAALAIACASASVAYQRVGPTRLVEGEGFCPGREACRVPALAGGFPLPYLVDDPQVSVPDALFIGEDDFRPGAFALDVGFYLALALAVRRLARGARETPGS
jgi:hypothetical protein